MAPTLLRTGLRDLLRRPLHTGLLVLGVALGVAVVVSIDIASESAERSFSRSAEAVAGRATHQILGGPSGVPLSFYRTLSIGRLVDGAAPVVEVGGVALELGRQSVRLLGTDPIAEGPFRDYLGAAARGPGLAALMAQPGGCLLGAAAARRHGLSLGARLHVVALGRALPLTVVGLVETSRSDEAEALDGLVLLDVGALQRLLGRPDRLTRIDVIATPAQAAALARALPAGLRLAPAGEPAARLRDLSAAFRLNLTALSLLALVVGAFLVYNTVSFAVIQRRAVFGTLRVLGVTGGQILALVLLEAAAAGAAGALLGHLLGYLLGQGVLRLVARTLNDLYYTVAVDGAALRPGSVLKGMALAIATALGAALIPALEASRVEPVTALRPSALAATAGRWLPRVAVAGVALAATGGVLLRLETPLPVAFAALFAVVLGGALVVPILTRGAMRLASPLLSRLVGVVGTLAARTVGRSVGRTGVAIAALMTAVAVATGVSLMIGSFRATVRDWLDLTLVADLYVDAPLAGARVSGALPPGTVGQIRSVPGVASVETYRRVRVMSSLGEIALGVSDTRRPRSLALYRFRGSGGHPWRQVEAGGVVVSESFARRHPLADRGGALTLATDHGPATFPVAGVFYDYSSEEGVVLMSRRVYDLHWDDPDVTSVAVYVADGRSPGEVGDSLRRALAGTALRVTPTRTLKAEALRVFDRTFAVTEALRVLALGVAFIGVWSALLSLEVERARELATLQALGATPGQVAGLCLLETGLMGLEAGLLAIPLGVLLAVILVDVINVRSFGWTMHLVLAPRAALEPLAVSLLASLGAALYPIRRLLRAPVAAALRTE